MSEIQIQHFNKEVDGSTTRVFTATLDGQPVGSIDVSDWNKVGGWINWVFVDVNHRRKGIAKLLLHRIAADARAAGKQGLGLTVKQENTPAQALYRDLGFCPCYSFASGEIAMTLHL